MIVVGGGDTGTDCVGTSMRHGCKSLTQLEILPRPPDTRQPDNPWPEWPKVYKLDYGQEEAKARFGADPRVYLTTGEKFVGDENGNVKELHVYDVEWAKNEQGAFIPKRVLGSEKVLQADLVLLAMGFLGPEETLPKRWESSGTRARMRRPITVDSTPTCRESLPQAIVVAVRALSCGPSMRVAVLHENAIAS